jgi:hypothetical protein
MKREASFTLYNNATSAMAHVRGKKIYAVPAALAPTLAAGVIDKAGAKIGDLIVEHLREFLPLALRIPIKRPTIGVQETRNPTMSVL